MIRKLDLPVAAVLVAAATLLFLLSSPAGAQERVVVGTKEAPPFAMENPDGTWKGISIELWNRIADRLGLASEYRELPLNELIQDVEAGRIDAAAAALTITAEREEMLDFSHAYYTSGLGIAVNAGGGGGILDFLGRFVSADFLRVIFVLVLLLAAVGVLAWLFERKRNPEQFGGGPLKGVLSGFWWSAVTMTTVGYGDKAPQTIGGRLLGVVWMFAAILLISTFTAAIASSFTVSRLESQIQGPDDLPRVRTGAVAGSTGEDYLRDRLMRPRVFETTAAGLEALEENEIDALVYDAPILRYLIHQRNRPDVAVLPFRLLRQDYGIAFPADSQLREPVNRVLLQTISTPEWEETLRRYLGD